MFLFRGPALSSHSDSFSSIVPSSIPDPHWNNRRNKIDLTIVNLVDMWVFFLLLLARVGLAADLLFLNLITGAELSIAQSMGYTTEVASPASWAAKTVND